MAKKHPTLSEALQALESLIREAGPDDPWDEKTVDIRSDIEAGERERVKDAPGLPPEAHERSSLVRLHDSQHWEQIVIAVQDAFWVIDMGEKGPVVQTLELNRVGRPYTLSNLEELEKFEQEFGLDMTPWPGYIVVSKKKAI